MWLWCSVARCGSFEKFSPIANTQRTITEKSEKQVPCKCICTWCRSFLQRCMRDIQTFYGSEPRWYGQWYSFFIWNIPSNKCLLEYLNVRSCKSIYNMFLHRSYQRVVWTASNARENPTTFMFFERRNLRQRHWWGYAKQFWRYPSYWYMRKNGRFQ